MDITLLTEGLSKLIDNRAWRETGFFVPWEIPEKKKKKKITLLYVIEGVPTEVGEALPREGC